MTLQRQLLIVSLCILFLPWAGCQYVQEMEKTLRDGQNQALLAHAQAVATTLAVQAPDFFTPSQQSIDATKQHYFHPLPSPMILDGYDSDWLSLGFQPFTLPSKQGASKQIASEQLTSKQVATEQQPNTSVQVYTGAFQDTLYLLFSVTDTSPIMHNPQTAGIANGDHIILHGLLDSQTAMRWYLRSSGSGNFTARYTNTAGSIRQEHRLRGMWQETRDGYKVEVQLPKSMIGAHLGITYIDSYVDASENDAQLLGTVLQDETGRWQTPQPWVSLSSPLTEIVQPYTRDDLRITLIDPQQWIIARVGKLNNPQNNSSSPPSDTPWWLTWFYRLALDENNFDLIDNPLSLGRMTAEEATLALQGTQGKAWYRDNEQRIGRVSTPIQLNGAIVGAVVVEQNTDALMAATSEAFTTLFFTILSTMGTVVFVLLIYASLLSLRIRRLSRAADNAIGDDGKIREHFLESRARDEIGDLTRSYGQLLNRLKDYTDYLRTLASKLSHELRTPLAVVKSSLDNLDHSNLSDDALRYHERAREGANRLSVILNAMSAANRMEESIHQAQRETFDLTALLNDVLGAYTSAYPNHRFALQTDVEACPFYGSPDLIVQMLDKLVDNAVDFSPPNTTIECMLQQHKRVVRLSIRNQGPLLPEHMQGQLFDSLVSLREGSVNKNGKDDKTHLGLGLYIVRLIVDFHQGHIQAKNNAALDGVTFTMEFPLTS